MTNEAWLSERFNIDFSEHPELKKEIELAENWILRDRAARKNATNVYGQKMKGCCLSHEEAEEMDLAIARAKALWPV